MHSAVHQAIAAVWRIESARIVAVVARMVRDIGVAEELAQDALVSALEHWPRQGVPALYSRPLPQAEDLGRFRRVDPGRLLDPAGGRRRGIYAPVRPFRSARAMAHPDWTP